MPPCISGRSSQAKVEIKELFVLGGKKRRVCVCGSCWFQEKMVSSFGLDGFFPSTMPSTVRPSFPDVGCSG